MASPASIRIRRLRSRLERRLLGTFMAGVAILLERRLLKRRDGG